MDLRRLEVREWGQLDLPRQDLADEDGLGIAERFRDRLSLDFPSARTGGRWLLKPENCVGTFPLRHGLELHVTPKTPVGNLFRMISTAYDVDIHEFPGTIEGGSLDELFDYLAGLLARRVLRRFRQGLYATYVTEADRLSHLRGALDVAHWARAPWQTRLPCEFQEHTRDIEENQILVWTLSRILGTDLCRKARQEVREAAHAMASVALPRPFPAAACVGRAYNRLNQDYKPLLALCRFFLSHTGPAHEAGSHRSIPFLVDMPQLFERFVHRWLAAHLPAGWQLNAQERVDVRADGGLHFNIDLVLRAPDGRVTCVLDTKYKVVDSPGGSDVHQAVAYAESLHCSEAVLIFPIRPTKPAPTLVGKKTVHCAAFDLAGDLDNAGRKLLRELSRLGTLDGLGAGQ